MKTNYQTRIGIIRNPFGVENKSDDELVDECGSIVIIVTARYYFKVTLTLDN